ncbi:hypothetical protein ACGGZK_03575 [Agromyces sp. MMS24-K17]|uniref:hypothetical protein n=1 Tax=Agromyces sp. MMS24-K17 TaxID=3372850 RepID=UPI0037553588
MEPDASAARIAELQRLVFGRPDGHLTPEADELAALLARQSKPADVPSGTPVDRDRVEASDFGGGSGAPEVADAPGASDAPEASEPEARRRPRGRLAVALVAAVVVAGGALLVPVLTETSTADSALAVLQSPRHTGELVPVGLPEDAASSARFMDTTLGFRFWLARTQGGDFCLVAQRENWAGIGTACTDPEQFRTSGLTIGVRSRSILAAVRPAGVADEGGVTFTLSPRATEVTWSPASGEDLAHVTMLRPERRTETVMVWVGEDD